MVLLNEIQRRQRKDRQCGQSQQGRLQPVEEARFHGWALFDDSESTSIPLVLLHVGCHARMARGLTERRLAIS
jgi:hypothetical protein